MMKAFLHAPPLLTVLALSGCSPFSTLQPGGREADWVATLGWWLIALMSVTIIIMGVLVVWGALRRRGSLSEHLPIDADGGKHWILIGGLAIPISVLTVLFFVTIGTLRALPGDVPEPDLELNVTAHQWWWEIDYLGNKPAQRFSTANEIHIPVGKQVAVNLASADVIHSFWVPRLHGKLDLIPGHSNRLVLQADEPGVYEGECAEYCGVQHAHMRFVVVAQSVEAYQAWAQAQRQPAATPTDPQLVAGKKAFEQYACAMCHRVRGTKALASVAPDLTHFASRRTIAGTLPNTRARLQAWIVNAQALKPGVRMPALDQFDGKTLNVLAAYVESLK